MAIDGLFEVITHVLGFHALRIGTLKVLSFDGSRSTCQESISDDHQVFTCCISLTDWEMSFSSIVTEHP